MTSKEVAQFIYGDRKKIEKAKKEYQLTITIFGQAFRKDRQKTGLSLGQMAERLGLSKPYLSDVELGRRAPNDKILNFNFDKYDNHRTN